MNNAKDNAKASETPKKSAFYRLFRPLALRISPDYTLIGTENLPEEPCIIVGNHCQIYGPLAAEFSMPRMSYAWCAAEMMERKEVPAYAYDDFWPEKRRGLEWLYRLLSRLAALPLPGILTSARTIPVYHDSRVMTTFRQTVKRLKEGSDIVIFPEYRQAYNGILWQFREHFPDVARLYHRITGTALCFVPAYISPALKSISFGRPVQFRPEADPDGERERIRREMMAAVTALAAALPEHTVIPYPNMPRKRYPLNTQILPAAEAGREEDR